jgi:uncharacterized protein HemX
MSTPEDAGHLDQPSTPTEHGVPAPEPPLDVARALWQLRMLTCWLGLGLLAVSLAFNAFVWKQNRNLLAETGFRTQQAARAQNNQQRLRAVIEELAQYSRGNPESTAIFKRSGIDIGLHPAPGAPSSSVPTP